MELQNSYIFLKNPYAKEEKADNPSNDGTIVLNTGNPLQKYMKASFPTIIKVDDYRKFYKEKYTTDLHFGKTTCKVEFIITEVIDTKYLDIVVKGNNKTQIVKCLEHIQYSLLSSGVREKYIDIISYDAVSEYYCNKIYPKLNTLERNLRKLLFNIYIVNFGRDYYKATVDKDLQNKIKRVINTDSSKEETNNIKTDYNTTTKKEAEEIERLQRFFYSFEYIDIQKLLFTQNWTSADEVDKNKFLDDHPDLSKLSDEKLREAFSKYIPKSDWERFFSNKINIVDISELIEQIRLHRNSVAHFKFFYKANYDECNKLLNSLNSAIIKAIKITENKDFAEKNLKNIPDMLKNLSKALTSFVKSIVEITQKTIADPTFFEIYKKAEESTLIKSLGNIALNSALVENTQKEQGTFNENKPSTQEIIPPYID